MLASVPQLALTHQGWDPTTPHPQTGCLNSGGSALPSQRSHKRAVSAHQCQPAHQYSAVLAKKTFYPYVPQSPSGLIAYEAHPALPSCSCLIVSRRTHSVSTQRKELLLTLAIQLSLLLPAFSFLASHNAKAGAASNVPAAFYLSVERSKIRSDHLCQGFLLLLNLVFTVQGAASAHSLCTRRSWNQHRTPPLGSASFCDI
jgi:hypothetical protein